jgi:hypothetical protein
LRLLLDYRRAAVWLTEARDKLAVEKFPMPVDEWRYYLGIQRFFAALVELAINVPFSIEILEAHEEVLNTIVEQFRRFLFRGAIPFIVCSFSLRAFFVS